MSIDLRFRRLTDMFVRGKAVELPDGSYLWIQVINAYERDECISDAQTARARLVLALKEKGDERTKVLGRLADLGRTTMEIDLAAARASGKTPDIINELRQDPDWKERVDILMRSDFEESAAPPTPEELLLLTDIQKQFLDEMRRREDDERDFLQRKYERMSDDAFIDEWVEEWIERRGGELASAEYQLTEMWYATRYCEARKDENGQLDHGRCNGHRDRVFASKNEARSAPNGLQLLIRAALAELNVVGSDPKDSASAASSSGSSPTPSAEEASTPSTSSAIQPAPPGT